MDLDVKKIRQDFPNLHVSVHGKPLVYFDNAATTFKPRLVAQAMDEYYQKYTSNVHRGVHELSEKATAAYEGTRGKVQKFLNARVSQEIIFTRGTTEPINLIAYSYSRHFLKKATRSSFPKWNTIPTSCPGRCSAKKKGAS